jgi:hypothetical protein
MYIITYLYNKLFVNNKHINVISIEEKTNKQNTIQQHPIYVKICDMKIISKEEADIIKNMSIKSLRVVIDLLFCINNTLINLLLNEKNKSESIYNSEFQIQKYNI